MKDLQYSKLICWGDDGSFFKILQPKLFAEVVLPHFYKHSNLNSFIRQVFPDIISEWIKIAFNQ